MFLFKKKANRANIFESEVSELADSELKIPQENKGGFQFELELKPHLIDDILIVQLPKEYIPFESDRFRAMTEDKLKLITITNYAKPWNGESIDKKFLENLKSKVYEMYVKEGGYVPYDDYKATDTYVRNSFKVDTETQYYFTSARIIDGKIVVTDFIIRQIGEYDKTIMPTLEIISNLIEIKPPSDQ